MSNKKESEEIASKNRALEVDDREDGSALKREFPKVTAVRSLQKFIFQRNY